MSLFPASSSILSASHLQAFLQSAYGFSAACTCGLIKAGINHTYLVTDGEERFVFRVYSLHWRSELEIVEEIRLLQHLQENGLPVSYALADLHQHYVQTLPAIEGDRYGVLFSYAPGDKILDLSAETHGKAGILLARLHQRTRDFSLQRVTYTPATLLDNTLPNLAQFLAADSVEMSYMINLHRHLHAVLATADPASLRSGAVHVDIWFDNFNINTRQEITIFDFDFCGNGWLCTDVAYYLLQLYATATDAEDYALKKGHFLAGYNSLTPLSREEERLLPALGLSLYFFYFGVQCDRFENWANVFLNEAYLKRYIQLRIKKYADFQGLILF